MLVNTQPIESSGNSIENDEIFTEHTNPISNEESTKKSEEGENINDVGLTVKAENLSSNFDKFPLEYGEKTLRDKKALIFR